MSLVESQQHVVMVSLPPQEGPELSTGLQCWTSLKKVHSFSATDDNPAIAVWVGVLPPVPATSIWPFLELVLHLEKGEVSKFPAWEHRGPGRVPADRTVRKPEPWAVAEEELLRLSTPLPILSLQLSTRLQQCQRPPLPSSTKRRPLALTFRMVFWRHEIS